MVASQQVTGAELLEFLDSQVRARTMNAGTANSRRTAVRQVLQISFGSDWERSSFQRGDVDELLVRFAEAHQHDFTADSLQSYRSNFRRTVELKLGDAPTSAADGWMTYRFPLRESVTVELHLPIDLTPAEASRLAALITALPVAS
jgi:hypothetical protein